MPQEERDQIATDFRTGTRRALITTEEQNHDIDIAQVPQIINYDFPKYVSKVCPLAGLGGSSPV